MYRAQLSKADFNELATPGDDRPVVRWPKPQIRRFTEGDRTVVQLMLSADALAELEEAEGEIELQIVPEAVDET
jgi:hypothetical protein